MPEETIDELRQKSFIATKQFFESNIDSDDDDDDDGDWDEENFHEIFKDEMTNESVGGRLSQQPLGINGGESNDLVQSSSLRLVLIVFPILVVAVTVGVILAVAEPPPRDQGTSTSFNDAPITQPSEQPAFSVFPVPTQASAQLPTSAPITGVTETAVPTILSVDSSPISATTAVPTTLELENIAPSQPPSTSQTNVPNTSTATAAPAIPTLSPILITASPVAPITNTAAPVAPSSPPVPVAGPVTPATEFQVKSAAFLDETEIPLMYTNRGDNYSPPLEWINIPDGTESFVLIMSDTDSSTPHWKVHWMVYNIPHQVSNLVENVLFQGETVVLKNSWDSPHYYGPNPPEGETHNYLVEVFALDTTLTIEESAIAGLSGHKLKVVLKAAMKDNELGIATMTGYVTGPPAPTNGE